MYLLKRQVNLADPKGTPGIGDIVVSADHRSSYVIAPDKSYRRLSKEDHVTAIQKLNAELAEIPIRRKLAAEAGAAISRQADLLIAQKAAAVLAARTDRMIVEETARIRSKWRAQPWYRRLADAFRRWRKRQWMKRLSKGAISA